jgi:hypothetical protein
MKTECGCTQQQGTQGMELTAALLKVFVRQKRCKAQGRAQLEKK